MTKITFTLIFLLTLNGRTLAQSPSNVKTILDSLEVLKNVGGFVDGYSYPPTAEETRLHSIATMLFNLPFTEAKKLMKDRNKFARVYGFVIVTKRYFDSLTKLDLKIFNDKAMLPLYTQTGNMDAGITVGKYCEMAYASTIEERKNSAKQKDVIVAVRKFIKENAEYPESYESIEFSGYIWGGDHRGLNFEIQHKYSLKNKEDSKIDVVHYFVLDKDFKIVLIETNRSNTYWVDPPAISEWISKFGKAK